MNRQSNRIFALVDCNNFYVSCERVFNPALEGRPILVMSNNDGCVVARSNEVKSLGIPMGTPIFKVRHLIERHNVVCLSSNYTLYGDMSRRVMETLGGFAPKMEIYSIDEAFLDLTGFAHCDVTVYARQICDTVRQWTGIPVSIGLGRTKTLAKLANHLAKKAIPATGVYNLADAPDLTVVLSQAPVEAIWGIGSRIQKKLNRAGIMTAAQLCEVDDTWMRTKFGVTGLRTVWELRGRSCLNLEDAAPNKNILCSKSFGRSVETLEDLCESIAAYTSRAAEKLRGQKLAAGVITVFIMTNLFRGPRYVNYRTCELPVACNNTPELITHALDVLRRIYRQGYRYKKAGVLLDQLVPEDRVQGSLFDDISNRRRGRKLMAIMDAVNDQMSAGTLFSAACGLERRWKTRFGQRSFHYTTSWAELPIVRTKNGE